MGVFSDLHCRYLGTNCISGFNQIGGHEIQWVFSDPVMLDQSWNTGWYEK